MKKINKVCQQLVMDGKLTLVEALAIHAALLSMQGQQKLRLEFGTQVMEAVDDLLKEAS